MENTEFTQEQPKKSDFFIKVANAFDTHCFFIIYVISVILFTDNWSYPICAIAGYIFGSKIISKNRNKKS